MRLSLLYESPFDLEIPEEIVFDSTVWRDLAPDETAPPTTPEWSCRVLKSVAGEFVVVILFEDVSTGRHGIGALNIVEGIGGRRFLEMGRMYPMYLSDRKDDTMSSFAFDRIEETIGLKGQRRFAGDSHCPNASFPSYVDVLSTRIQT